MINSKHINKIIACAVAFALLMSALMVYAATAYETANIPDYQKRLFNGEAALINIKVDEKNWEKFIDNATEKEWIIADLVINGESFNGIGIRAKGNSSLEKVEKSESGKYSLNIKFNKFVDGQTYYGLDTFCLNNMIDDATYMKEYLSYEIMRYIGVAAPLTNYAKVTVNGEDYGFCLILERYDESFLDRVYNTSGGQLYNVKKDGNDNSGGSLLYTGDNKSNYSAIFDNAVFNKNSNKREERVITAIKNLNEGTNLEEYWDIDGILRYFAAHTVVVNLKSYISDQQQNYYLYERHGKITILPWSYHLSFGGFPKSIDAEYVVNFPIDTPVYKVDMEDRPLLDKLLEVPEYKERYREYLRRIVEGYFDSGLFEETINNTHAKIGEYVKNDVSGFYSYEQYIEALPNLTLLGILRAESITGQLNGTIPSSASGQNADFAALTDASSVNLSSLR